MVLEEQGKKKRYTEVVEWIDIMDSDTVWKHLKGMANASFQNTIRRELEEVIGGQVRDHI